MDSILIVSKSEINNDELKNIIVQLGGYWNDDPSLDCGVISQDSGTVYCSSSRSPNMEYCENEISEFANRIGNKPQSVVVIDIGHGEGSTKVALDLAEHILQRWGGLLDDNGVLE